MSRSWLPAVARRFLFQIGYTPAFIFSFSFFRALRNCGSLHRELFSFSGGSFSWSSRHLTRIYDEFDVLIVLHNI